jgi:uncharacterized protein YciI
MEFFFYCRDRAGAGATRRELLKQHWAFMRGYKDRMIARGPTMSADGKAVTGSMHIVDLPDAAAAEVFAYQDPLAKGGVFEEIIVRRFRNLSGRTMWQFAGNPANLRFLFIGEARAASSDTADLLAAQERYFKQASRAAQVIVFGPLFDADGHDWQGTALLIETSGITESEALVAGDPAHASGRYASTQLHAWRFGGEENLQDLLGR